MLKHAAWRIYRFLENLLYASADERIQDFCSALDEGEVDRDRGPGKS